MVRADGHDVEPASARRRRLGPGRRLDLARVPIRLRLTMIFAVAMLFVLAVSGTGFVSTTTRTSPPTGTATTCDS